MRIFNNRCPAARAALLLAAALAATGASASGSIVIGTGGVTGVYYPTGAAICRMVNKTASAHRIRCSARSTAGSIDNLNAIRAGTLDLGIVQSDWQYHAWRGSDRFERHGPYSELRSLFSVHSEPFTVVARVDSGIETFDDLKGKRVNVGNPGSGQRGTMEVLLSTLGWSMTDFARASELPSQDQARALCDNRVDAIVFTVGHPNGSIKEATTACDAVLVAVSGPAVDALIRDKPYYRKTTVPGGLYAGNPEDTDTFGVAATVVSSIRTPAETAYRIVQAVFENFAEFRVLHPAFSDLRPRAMARDALTAPVHDGAARYFAEAGLR